MICCCCGFEAKEPIHKTDNGKKVVCNNCWNNPDMFFPEKIEEDQRLTLLSKMAQERGNNDGILEITAIKLSQKGVDMYVGKMRVIDILNLYELDKFKEEELDGYQRDRYEERTVQLVEYIEKSPLAVMPALLVGLRETHFDLIQNDLGILKIYRKKGAIWIIDGQHRVGGFSKIKDQFMFTKKLGASMFSDLMEYEMPVVFIDSAGAADKIKPNTTDITVVKLSPQDIEKTIFFIVNKTQRGISPSLKDALQYSIKTSGIEGLSLVDKEAWRICGTQIAIRLNCREDSPLKAMINIGGQRNSGKPIQLNSFVSSLEPLFKTKSFLDISIEDKIDFLNAYWLALKCIVPQAFVGREVSKKSGEEFGKRFALNINDKSKKKQQGKKSERYLLLTSLSIHTLHRIARDLLYSLTQKGMDTDNPQYYENLLLPLKTFNWKSCPDGPLSALGGMKGVGKAYDLLSDKLGQEKYKEPNAKTLAAAKTNSLKAFTS